MKEGTITEGLKPTPVGKPAAVSNPASAEQGIVQNGVVPNQPASTGQTSVPAPSSGKPK